MIREIVSEVNCLLRDGYPYSALGMALTLPDICGNIAYPKMGTGERYRKWFDEFALPLGNWPTESDFITLNGAVCYKLRCAYLHKGNFDLGEADAVKDIKRFTLHYNRDPLLRLNRIVQMVGGSYHMDIDLGVFCWQLCQAATNFLKTIQSEGADVTVEIEDETPSEEEQKRLQQLFEEKAGCSMDQIIEMKRKDPTLMFDF